MKFGELRRAKHAGARRAGPSLCPFMAGIPIDSPITEAPWRAGLRAARAHLIPGLVLQAVALALVLAYY